MPVKYGVIGCGAIGAAATYPKMHANPDSVLIGIAEFNQTRCDELGSSTGQVVLRPQGHAEDGGDRRGWSSPGQRAACAADDRCDSTPAKHVLCESRWPSRAKRPKAMIDAAKR